MAAGVVGRTPESTWKSCMPMWKVGLAMQIWLFKEAVYWLSKHLFTASSEFMFTSSRAPCRTAAMLEGRCTIGCNCRAAGLRLLWARRRGLRLDERDVELLLCGPLRRGLLLDESAHGPSEPAS